MDWPISTRDDEIGQGNDIGISIIWLVGISCLSRVWYFLCAGNSKSNSSLDKYIRCDTYCHILSIT